MELQSIREILEIMMFWIWLQIERFVILSKDIESLNNVHPQKENLKIMKSNIGVQHQINFIAKK